MLSYPTEFQKGKYIAVFWLIFNMGAVVGASVSLGQNFHSKVSDFPTYIHRNIDYVTLSKANSGRRYTLLLYDKTQLVNQSAIQHM